MATWKMEECYDTGISSFLSIVIVMIRKSGTPKVTTNDKNGDATVVCSLELQYKGTKGR